MNEQDLTIPITVIVAEDDPTLRETLGDLIGIGEGLQLAGLAKDADEAVELAAKRRPDVALLDVKMPGGGGPSAARRIRVESPGTRIVALSAYGDKDSVVEMLKSGAIGYVLKGSSAKEILIAVRAAHAGEAVLSRQVAFAVVEELLRLLELSENQGRQLAKLDQTKSELIQTLAHEIRTPLTVIGGIAKVFGGRGMRMDRPKMDELVGGMSRATARLTRLAANISAAARLQFDPSKLSAQPVSAGELLAEVSKDFRSEGERLVIQARAPASEATVWADKDLASRALVLVTENALGLSPANEVVEIGVEAGDETVSFLVSDRGPGVPGEFESLVFDSFTQVDSTATRAHEGLGIGLYLTRRIMEVHGGSVSVVKREGGGSIFTITFPSAPASGDSS